MTKRGQIKLTSVVGARPQFIKLAPLAAELLKSGDDFTHCIIHTGQHYDYRMSQIFFKELGIAEPQHHLDVGSGGHGQQTGRMLEKLEDALIKENPQWVLVYGDTNTTLAGALAASKMRCRVAHIEAGLRSFNRSMPEEINRILVDHCSDALFCPTETAVQNLRKEGFLNVSSYFELDSDAGGQPCGLMKAPLVVKTGDIMFDAFLLGMEIARKRSKILDQLGLERGSYCLATIHRAENTDNPLKMKSILDVLAKISREMPVVFPVHPRTLQVIDKARLKRKTYDRCLFIDPVSYFDMLRLEENAFKILTDSGGVQKEAYFARVPCVTLRNETEWIETVASGWNVVVGTDAEAILKAFYSARPSEVSTDYESGGASKKILRTLRIISK